jgi:polyhydroxybutyrate depolymerase
VTDRRLRALQIGISALALAIGIGVLLIPWWWVGRRLHYGIDLEPATYAYPADEAAACAADSRPGRGGRGRSERTPEGVGYFVAAPANYDARRAHPLIVVFAPHGANRFLTERFTGLTHVATEEGFVVAYVDAHPIDPGHLAELGRVAADVANRWCIDTERVFFTGHSDGGTAATALAVLGLADPPPAAIAPSAAGFRREDLDRYACPRGLPVMLLHNRNDELFPGFGRAAVEWWARCNACSGETSARVDGCIAFSGCPAAAPTLFCENDGTHLDWPERNEAMLRFFEAAPPSRNSTRR